MYFKSKECRLCLSRNIKDIFKLNKIPLGERYYSSKIKAAKSFEFPITISWCKDCKNVQLKEVVNTKNLWKDYTYISGQTKAIDIHFKKFAKNTIKKFNLSKKDLVLDIGSNDGSLLNHFKKKTKVLGIDPARNIVEIANKRGIDSIAGLFNLTQSKNIKRKYGQPKIITAFNVFAHSENLREMLIAIKELLNNDGVFIFEVQYLKDIYKNKIIGTFFHEHMYHHSVTSLNNFFNAFNMTLYDVHNVNIQKGSIIGFVCKNGSKKVKKSVKKFLIDEKKNKLNNLIKLKSLKNFILNQKNECQKVLKKYSLRGIIAGYGAARSGPLLASNFGLDKYLKFLFDDHKLKVNKFSSFKQLKVLPSKSINQIKPSLCIILAYLHSKKILKINKTYVKNGGKFLLIYPKIKIVSKKNFKKFL